MSHDPHDPKEMERQLFKAAPESAKKLHKAAKRLIREQKRRDWWNHHKPKDNQ